MPSLNDEGEDATAENSIVISVEEAIDKLLAMGKTNLKAYKMAEYLVTLLDEYYDKMGGVISSWCDEDDYGWSAYHAAHKALTVYRDRCLAFLEGNNNLTVIPDGPVPLQD